MDPGTAAIAVLSTITGVAGYGAMKLNSNQALAADARANELAAEKIEKVRRELTLATEDMKRKAEQELRAKQAEVDAFKRDLNSLKQSKAALEGKVQEASEGERLFVSIPLSEFKKAIGILKETPEIQSAIDPSKMKDVEKVFANYTSTTRLRISRGSLHSLYQDLQKAMGKPFMERDAFNVMFTNILRTFQPEAPQPAAPPPAAPQPAAPPPEVPPPEAAPPPEVPPPEAVPPPEVPQPEAPQPEAPQPEAPQPEAPPPAAPQPEAPQPEAPPPAAPQPEAPPPAAPQPEAPKLYPTNPTLPECKAFLTSEGIPTNDKAAAKRAMKKFSLKYHPNRLSVTRNGPKFDFGRKCTQIVYGENLIGTFNGGLAKLRKKKLRTRRGGKQRNVRRTRRSEDRADRTDSHSG
jgi:hypothetical protein